MPLASLPSLHTRRLTLRPVEARDLPDLHAVNGNPEVTRFLPYASWQSDVDGHSWLARMQALAANGTGRQLVLERRPGGQVIGTLLLFRHDEGSARLEIGYALGQAHWGQGLMREAVAAACRHAFVEAGIRRIEAEVNPANLASCRLLDALGFVHEGTLRQRWVAKGAAYDTRLYGLLTGELREAPPT